MFKIILIIEALIFSKLTFGQDINLIIKVNEKLEQSSFSNIYVTLDSVKSQKHCQVDYVPGNLKLPIEITTTLNADSSKIIFLHFFYNTYNKDGHQIAHFFTKLPQRLLKQPYLILNFYDFREKNYKKWYQKDKKQEFGSEFVYPTRGILIRNK